MTDRHRQLLPDSTYVGSEQVMCERLDDALGEDILASATFAVKMDVQGYEMEVLQGASRR